MQKQIKKNMIYLKLNFYKIMISQIQIKSLMKNLMKFQKNFEITKNRSIRMIFHYNFKIFNVIELLDSRMETELKLKLREGIF